jgi:versiconal hemiacetal acetate esterase
MGNLDIDDPFCRAISRSGGLVVVSIDYRLGPQNEHHVIKGDCYRGLRWALDNAKELNTTNGFISAGVSAGGNLAFSTALKAIDDGLQNQLVGLLALLPATIHPHSVPEELRPSYTAMEEHDQHTANTKSTMMAFWGKLQTYTCKAIITDILTEAYGAPPDDPYASPLLHPRLGDLKNVYMAIAGHDTLADDGLLMKQRLEQHR